MPVRTSVSRRRTVADHLALRPLQQGGGVPLSRNKEKLIARLRDRKGRRREGAVLVEGLRSIRQALDAGADLRFAVVSPSLRRTDEGREVERRLRASGTGVEEVDDAILSSLSDTEAPQGALLVCEEPPAAPADLLRTEARLLVLDAVQDPGNLGTLVRAARAFGLDGVVALDGSVDPWNPKAVRASAGTSFAMPVIRAGWSEVEPALPDEMRLLAAGAGGRDVEEVSGDRPWALVVGNEGAGIRREILDSAADRVGVPMPGGAESLNVAVAAAILLYVLRRKGDR